MPKAGILILHGFTGSPREAYGLRDYLKQKLGSQVVTPCLPGHGSNPDNLTKVSQEDWYQTAKRAYLALAVTGPVVVVGISFGASLMFRLAADPDIASRPVALVALGAPARLSRQLSVRLFIKFAKLWTKTYQKRGPHKREQIPNYRVSAYDRIPLVALEEFLRFLEQYMRPQLLARVTAPVLLVQSTIDPVVASWSLKFFQRYLSSSKIEVLIWPHHRHLLTQGGRRDELSKKISEFIKQQIS